MQNSDDFEAFGTHFSLQRYPILKNSELRAWDTADQYLLNTLEEQKIELSNIVIINDNYGALTIALTEHKPRCYSDSWLSREAIYNNIALNNLDKTLRFFSDIKELTKDPLQARCVIGRIPKTKSQLAFLLQHLQSWVHEDCTLLLAGMDKHLSKGQYALLEQYFGPSKFYPGIKKARIWEAKVDKRLISAPLNPPLALLPEFELELSSQANVFSQDKLDIGSRFFLDNFDKLPDRSAVADLACGNGVLGLSYLRHHPQATMIFSDESFQAIQSSETNWRHNLPEADASFRADDGLKQAKPSELDLVICNPPFHIQHTVGTDIAFSLFKDAFRALKKTGELWIVANRHLGYHVSLKKLFGNCSMEAANKKFVILKAVKHR